MKVDKQNVALALIAGYTVQNEKWLAPPGASKIPPVYTEDPAAIYNLIQYLCLGVDAGEIQSMLDEQVIVIAEREDRPVWMLETRHLVEAILRAFDIWDDKCPDCQAAMINGVYCHEHGCPTAAKEKREQKMREALEEQGEPIEYEESPEDDL